MKLLILGLAITVASVGAFAAKPSIKLSGHFTLVAGEKCPQTIEVRQPKKSYIIVLGQNKDESMSRHYPAINQGIKKYSDDPGFKNHELTTVELVNNEKVLSNSERTCWSHLFSKQNCNEWTLNHTLTQHNETQITVYTPQRPNAFDYAGFPLGSSCSYQKLAN